MQITMKPIIAPIDKEAIKAELAKVTFLRKTNFGENEIYEFSALESPILMQEVGRLRELAFRTAGGGTGDEIDIDNFDTDKDPYIQLIVWDPEEEEIVGGYRYFACCGRDQAFYQDPLLATTDLFKFSETFKATYLPLMIELGRSFVQPKYQSKTAGRKALFALDNLWDGLGCLVVKYPEMQYFFGKVTMYLSYNQKARDLILYFMNKYFPDPENLVVPFQPLYLNTPEEELKSILCGADYKEDHRILNVQVRKLNENIPPLINSYMNLSSTMKTFGTSLNPHFGEVEETGIMIAIEDIYPTKKERHISSYTE